MQTLTDAVAVMVELGDVVHELQKERGLSSGFVSSKGTKFSGELQGVRRESDRTRKSFEDALAAFDKNHSKAGLGAAMGPTLQALSGLSATRQDVDSLRPAARQVIEAYTRLILTLVDGANVLLGMDKDPELLLHCMAYLELVRGKEFAGQERATLNGAFSSGSFTKELYKEWIWRQGAQAEHLKNFLNMTSPALRAFYESKLAAPTEKVDRMRALAFQNADKPALEGDAPAWFSASTARIDAMKDVESRAATLMKDESQAKRDAARAAFVINLCVAAAVALMALGLGYVMFRAIVDPLQAAVRFATGVADGDLNQSLATTSKDEIGTLCDALKAMLASLKEQIAKAEASSRQAADQARMATEAAQAAKEAQAQAEHAKREGMLMAAERLEDVVASVSSASAELSRQIEESSRGAGLQSSRVGETATSMEEMNATVLEVARNASQAAIASDEARKKAAEGQIIVSQVMDGIGAARSQSLELKAHMTELGAQAEAIGKIMGVIADIADQTNLLALNAAIEAARAGEAGRGFAVVADEVRKLAEKTMSATKEVAQSITGIQQTAKANIESVDKAVERIETATELAGSSRHALTEIVALVDNASMQVSSIATASEEQSAASEEINRSLEDVSRVSAETAEGMNEAAQAVMDLANQASGLQRLIAELQDQ